MARKRIRNLESSNDSNDATERPESKMGNCPHIAKGIDIPSVKKTWRKKEEISCLLCRKKSVNKREKTNLEDLWICLKCGSIGCGSSRQNHAQEHYETPRSDCHSVIAQLDSWTIRCLHCKSEINVDFNVKAYSAMEYLKRNFAVRKEEKEEVEDVPLSRSEEKSHIKHPGPAHDLKKATATNHKKFHPLPILGLENIGNTCYMNAVLQALSQTPGFVSELECHTQVNKQFFLKGGDNLICKEYGGYLPSLEGTLGEAGQLTKAVLKLTRRVKDGQHLRWTGICNENPGDILRMMKKFSNTFYVGEQHDSHELLRLLLEGLRTEDSKRYHRGILNSLGIYPSIMEVTEVEREHFMAYKKLATDNELIVDKIFGGSLVSILKCIECGETTTMFENFMDISLPVESEKPKPFQSQRWDKVSVEENKESKPSKHQLKKERKMARRGRRKNKGGRNVPEPNSSLVQINKANSSSDSNTESEADVEDNIDSETTGSSITIPILNNSDLDKTLESCDYAADVSFLETSGSEKQEQSIDKLYISSEVIYPPTPENVSVISYSDQSVVLQSSEPCEVIYRYSPEASLTEDFGSCEGGRGSPASSITQADWDEESNSKNDLSVLVKGMKKDVQLSDDSCPPPAPFELSEEDYVKSVPWGDTTKDMNSEVQLDSYCSGDRDELEKSLDRNETVEEGLSFNGNNQIVKIDELGDHQEIGRAHSDSGTYKIDSDSTLSNSILMGVSDIELDDVEWGATLTPQPDVEEKEYSAYKCLNHFFSKETLTGANKIGCVYCTKMTTGQEPKLNTKLVKANAHKQLLLFKLPKVLTIHFKRFEIVNSRMSKITRKVNFPMILDVAPYTSSKAKITENQAKYELYAVVEHSGHMTSGHYVAYVRVELDETCEKLCDMEEHRDASEVQVELMNQRNKFLSGDKPSSKWYLISDTHVREASFNEVMSAEAYLLFYKKIE